MEGIYWYNLSVSMNGQTLVQPNTGRALASRLLAVMGPSGAGKSLLLHSLAQLAPRGARVSGTVLGNGAEVSVPQRNMALLEQEVPFFSELTVHETVVFAAQLEGLSRTRAFQVAEKLLKRLRLHGVAERRVGERFLGSSGVGLSGGEQRRLALACALAGEEEVGELKAVLADEPTTGLDTFQAAEMVELLSEMGRSRHCATIMTIHQPRSSVWAMIEDVVLMGPGGRAVFCGSRDEILEHLSRQGHSCPVRGVNPADFIIDLVSVHSTGQEAVEDQQRIDRLARNCGQADAKVPEARASKAAPQPEALKAFWLLLQRAWLQTSRDKATNLSRLLATAGLGLIFGAQFGHFSSDDMTSASVTSRVGLLSFGAISMAFIGEMRALDRFAKEKKVVSRERASGLYGGTTYLCAKALAELPSDALFAALFATALKWRCGLRLALPQLLSVYSLIAVVCAALGLAIGAAIPNAERAMTAGIPIMTVHMLTGVIDPAGAAAAEPGQGMVLLRNISPIRYGIEALVQGELAGAVLAPSPSEAGKLGGVALLRSGDVFIERLGIARSFEEATHCLWALLLCHLAAAAALLALMKPRFEGARPRPKAVVACA